jgi:response regulator NasT
MRKHSQRWRVVVVDDHAPSRAAVAEAITAEGGQIVGNGNRALDALALVERYAPDVAVVAVGLPDGDGVEAARAVTASGRCPVVLLTHQTHPDVASRAAAAGVLGFLVKPIRPGGLAPALDVAVARFQELRALRAEGERLRRQLETRKLVERAKGVLMLRFGLSEPDAFRRIQKTAMDTRRTMAQVASALLASGELGARPAG